jgi:hypothetical protein|tara:strand:+ start:2651 stop:3067 length:417 start_codon:yes stop_codon:yes gene_type:complete
VSFLFVFQNCLSTLFVCDINSTPPIKNNVSGSGDPRRGGANSRVQRSPQGRVERSGLFFLLHHGFRDVIVSFIIRRPRLLVVSFFLSFIVYFLRLKNSINLFVQKADNNILPFSSFIQVLDFDGSNDAFRCVLLFFFF